MFTQKWLALIPNAECLRASTEKYCRGEVKIGEGLAGREVSLVWGREIPSREAMAPFWNPLRGESNPALASVPFYRGRNSYAVAAQGKG